jgi:hypothetical protein
MYKLVYAPYRAYRPIKIGPFLIKLPYTVKEYILFHNDKEVTLLYANNK